MHPEIELFWKYIVSSVDHILATMDGLEGDDLDWRPLDNASSLAILAIHTMGNLEENLLEILCGQPVHRQRDAEFAARGTTVEALRQRWQDLQARIIAALESVPPIELDRERDHPRRGRLSGRAVLMVAARHAAEHMGHAALTRDLLLAAQGKTRPPSQY